MYLKIVLKIKVYLKVEKKNKFRINCLEFIFSLLRTSCSTILVNQNFQLEIFKSLSIFKLKNIFSKSELKLEI